MRLYVIAIALVLAFVASAYAQDELPPPPSPADVAPPPEIVIPATPEEIPPPTRQPVRIEGNLDGNHVTQLKVGTIINGDVELYPRVRIKDADEIHPRAVPVIIAVMDPREGPWHPHYKIRKFIQGEAARSSPTPVVFVKVFVVPQSLNRLKIRREEIDLEYGDYEVNIDSEDGVVTIDYDD